MYIFNALWLATSLGVSSVIDYTLSVGNAEQAVTVELADKEDCGIKTELEIINKTVTVTVTVTEKPIFIICS